MLLLSLLLLLVLLLMMGRHQLLVELMLPDRARRVLLKMRGRNVVVLKVVLGGMRLTGGHHPKREAGASLTSPTAPAPTLSRLTLLLLLLLLPDVAFPASLDRCLSIVISSPPRTDALLATPTQPQVVPKLVAFIRSPFVSTFCRPMAVTKYVRQHRSRGSVENADSRTHLSFLRSLITKSSDAKSALISKLPDSRTSKIFLHPMEFLLTLKTQGSKFLQIRCDSLSSAVSKLNPHRSPTFVKNYTSLFSSKPCNLSL